MLTGSREFIPLLLPIVLCLLVVLYVLIYQKPSSLPATYPANTYGMAKYSDSRYGFSFWYPSTLQVTASSTDDNVDFPGGVEVQILQIGSLGGAMISVVNSPNDTISDEPANHASPINQTTYFYDRTSDTWMVTYPQGNPNGGSDATTTADVSKRTVSGLLMLPSGRRFDTTIVPLSTHVFLVISDGGGSSLTNQLASTITQTGASVAASAYSAALQAESNAVIND